MHGGVTTAISASEVHVPGRPKDPQGVKALTVAAMKCFEHQRPGGMRVWAGAIILEPGIAEADFEDIAAQGVWLAKADFGAVKTPFDYAPMIAWAKKHGMTTLVHTGGPSIPGSSVIWANHLIAMQPDVSFHTNGGPVAMPDEDYPRLVNESEIALQDPGEAWEGRRLRDQGAPPFDGPLDAGFRPRLSQEGSCEKSPAVHQLLRESE